MKLVTLESPEEIFGTLDEIENTFKNIEPKM